MMGITGIGQMTPAAQSVLQRAGGGMRGRSNGPKRRRTKKKAAASGARKRKRSRSKKPARLVKGSKAAKAYMAKIRRKRK
jgi:hypothetical protein